MPGSFPGQLHVLLLARHSGDDAALLGNFEITAVLDFCLGALLGVLLHLLYSDNSLRLLSSRLLLD